MPQEKKKKKKRQMKLKTNSVFEIWLTKQDSQAIAQGINENEINNK